MLVTVTQGVWLLPLSLMEAGSRGSRAGAGFSLLAHSQFRFALFVHTTMRRLALAARRTAGLLLGLALLGLSVAGECRQGPWAAERRVCWGERGSGETAFFVLVRTALRVRSQAPPRPHFLCQCTEHESEHTYHVRFGGSTAGCPPALRRGKKRGDSFLPPACGPPLLFWRSRGESSHAPPPVVHLIQGLARPDFRRRLLGRIARHHRSGRECGFWTEGGREAAGVGGEVTR